MEKKNNNSNLLSGKAKEFSKNLSCKGTVYYHKNATANGWIGSTHYAKM
ncbi:MAG: hypothetical protein PHX63_08345 [Eubacteriales bacterium]|nr:hypothetical protein [Eubacteriales bacterium]